MLLLYLLNITIITYIMLRFIKTANTGVKQTFGKFTGLCSPGLNIYIPFVQTITPVSNMIQSKDFEFRVKTKDNVFTDLSIGVQLKVKAEDTERAFFSLTDPESQIDSYIQNVVRSKAPTMTLDELYESQGEIAKAVSDHLHERMSEYGWTIVDTLVNDIVPAQKVAHAMNEINASERLKAAAKNEADADYIRQVRAAEADKDRKILQGEGISGQRLAILKGYEQGVEDMSTRLGLTSKDIIDFVMKTQHLDTLESIGKSPNTKTVFLSHQPQGFESKVMDGTMQADEK